MKNLLRYLRGYVKESILGPLFKLFEATLELIVPLVIAKTIDEGILKDDRAYSVKMCLVLVLLGAVGLLFSVIAQYYAARAAVGCTAKLRHHLFAHIGKLSYSEIDTLGTSTLITRMTSDANQVQTGVNLALRLLLRSPFVVFGAMIMAFTIDTASALTFAVTIPVLSVIVFGIMLISIPLYKKVQSRLDRVLGKTRENLSGARVIRAFSREEEEILEFERRNGEFVGIQKFVGKISALMNPATYVIINLAILWLIYTGALQVESGILTQGMVVALYNYMSQILVELIKLANLIITITKSIAGAERIQSILSIEPSILPGEETDGLLTDTAIEFKNVTLTYKNAAAPSLSDISFKVKKGETLGIIGGTGSGKTSLVNLIPRFYDATEGEVFVSGRNVKNYGSEALLSKIAVVPQKAVLFAGSLRDNMKWGNKDATDEEIFKALRIAEAENLTKDKGGLDFIIEQDARNLSGGQKQRLTIARALVKEPEILILDDSASALDYATDARLRSSIRNMDGERTVVIVSQRAASIMHADKIIVLEDGEAEAIGTHEELLDSSPTYREIYYSQFKKENGK